MKAKAIDELGEIKQRRGVTYYHQLYTLLVMALSEGVIRPGSVLPSESELMKRFSISRNTVRRALAQLELEKRILRRRGSGSYALAAPVSAFSPNIVAEIIQDVGAANLQTSSRLLRIEKSATPEFVRRTDAHFGDVSLMVLRCRSFKSVPFMLSTSYVPEQLATQLTRRQLAQKTVLSALDEIGVEPAGAEQTTTAVVADSVATRHLGVEPSSALLCLHRLVKDRKGRSIAHQSEVYRPDRCHLQSRLSVERSATGLQWSAAKSPLALAWL
jgi:GntR family transcriptional regulator